MEKRVPIIPLFKSNYSILKSILTLEPGQEDSSMADSIIDICKENQIDTMWLVDDTMASYLPAYEAAKKAELKLRFGYRVLFKNEDVKGWHRNIIFPKNRIGYHQLVELATIAATKEDGVFLTYDELHSKWSENLILTVPFYDSFLDRNFLHGDCFIPEFRGIKPVCFIEENDLPFDNHLRELVENFAGNIFEIQRVQTIYYKSKKDALAYQIFRLMERKSGKSRDLEKPEMSHFSSNEFSFESFLTKNEQ